MEEEQRKLYQAAASGPLSKSAAPFAELPEKDGLAA
jgi:hypothetical protein